MQQKFKKHHLALAAQRPRPPVQQHSLSSLFSRRALRDLVAQMID